MTSKGKQRKDASRGQPGSRRTFLLAGGAMVTGLYPVKVHPSSANVPEDPSHRRILEIVNRYGSELGKARLV